MAHVFTRLLVTASAAGAILILARPDARAQEVVRVSGTGSSLGALQRMTDPFARANPGLRLVVLPSVGSNGAIKAVADGALDVAIAGRPLEPRERALGLVSLPYARTPFLFAVGPRAGVTGISTRQLVRIYRGEMETWPTGERVRVVLRPRTDVDVAIVRSISPELSAALDVAYSREGMLMALTNQECDEILSRTPGAIGPASLSELVADSGSIVPLAFNGVAPTAANLASGAYPLSKTFSAVVRPPPSTPVRRFVAFLSSPEARKILEATGNLPLQVPEARLDAGRP